MLHTNSFRKIAYLFFALSLTILVSSNIKAQKAVTNLSESTLENLNNAIKSKNDGLRKSGIELAGKYKVKETSEVLFNQLNIETDPNLRILILKSLYIIDDDKFMKEVYQLAAKDKNENVRKFASSICTMMELENSLVFIDMKN